MIVESSSPPKPAKVAYIVSRFPHLPETFIVREMNEVVRQGTDVILCPLLRNREPVIHAAAEPWVERAWFTPFVSRALLRDAMWWLRRDLRAAVSAVAKPLASVAATPNFLVGTLGILLKSFHLARRLREEEVDHVHAHFATHPTMAAWIIHRLTRIPYSFTAHAHDIYVHTAMLGEKIAAAAFVVTISDYNRALLARFGDESKIEIVRYGIDLERRGAATPRPDAPFTILSVASLQPYKGLEHLIRACAVLRERRSDDFRCLIAGRGELRDELERLISNLGLSDTVSLLGPRREEEVSLLLQGGHMFVLPSVIEPSGKMEGLPNALIEALAVGLPTVSTDISGIPEIVRPGETGILVPPGDPVAIADAIEHVMDDPEHSAELGRRGRALVEQEFSLARNARSLKRLFEERSRADARAAA